MDLEMITGKCPICGETLQIPAKLADFSCLYCGARLTQSDILPKADAEPFDEASFEAACSRLSGCITDYPGYHKKLLRNEFHGAFETYSAGCAPVFSELEAVAGGRADTDALLEKAAVRMLDDLAKTWKKSVQQEDDKVVIAIFLVPALRRMKLSISEPFCEKLRGVWMERYPKSPFYLATYEDIDNGFRKRRFCFITTAVCESEEKPDDCDELVSFRDFRDTWLMAQPDGAALVSEYYNIAPAIVTRIDLCTERERIYRNIRENWLSDCYDAIQQGNYEHCKLKYVEMVRTLENTYLH